MSTATKEAFDVADMVEQVTNAETVTLRRDRYGYHITQNGQEDFYRRVTTLLGGIPKPWLGPWTGKMVAEFALDHADEIAKLNRTDALKLLKGAPYSKRDDAGDRGTAIHNTIDAFVKKQPIPDGLTDDEAACAKAARDFLEARDSKILAAELTVFNKTLGYAGTLDLWDIKDSVSTILDWKSSASVYAEHAVQQVAYQRAEFAVVKKTPLKGKGEAWEGKVIPWGPHCAERLGIVHVEPTGATLYPIVNEDLLWKVFRAAAFTKGFLLNTDSYAGKTPRVSVYDDPITLTPTK